MSSCRARIEYVPGSSSSSMPRRACARRSCRAPATSGRQRATSRSLSSWTHSRTPRRRSCSASCRNGPGSGPTPLTSNAVQSTVVTVPSNGVPCAVMLGTSPAPDPSARSASTPSDAVSAAAVNGPGPGSPTTSPGAGSTSRSRTTASARSRATACSSGRSSTHRPVTVWSSSIAHTRATSSGSAASPASHAFPHAASNALRGGVLAGVCTRETLRQAGCMRALSVVPGRPATATVEDRPEPPEEDGAVLVDGLLMGVCGTDVEIARDGYGTPPPGATALVLGHESLGRVRDAPPGSGFAPGDLVAGVVRRPDGCPACADDQWDMCLTGGYVERGIKGADGYGATAWRADPRFLVKLDPDLDDLGVLLEPTSVVAKAWDQVDRIGARAYWAPKTALVTGAGPIGLLAALLGMQRGLEVTVVDLATDGPKPSLVADLGATYSSKKVPELGLHPDVVIECTGVGALVYDCLEHTGPNAIVALTGISASRAEMQTPLSALNKELVLTNEVVFGSVNAGRRHYTQAVQALAKADPAWLARLITKRVPLDSWPDALAKTPDDVKVVIDLQA